MHNRLPDVNGEFTIYCGKCHEVIREHEEYAETPRRWFEDGRIAGEWCCPSCSEDPESEEDRAVLESGRHTLQ